VPTVIVDVADDGPGMPPDIAEKSSIRFSRPRRKAPAWPRHRPQDRRRARGRIDMTTADGRGTKFRVTLPVEPLKKK
jgi:signal transduction histidine kinase